MDELSEARSISMSGPEADKAIADFRQQMREWGAALPPTELIITDFGLDDFASNGLIECWICNEMKAGYCGKYLFVFNGQSCPMHHHREKHETFLVVYGRVHMNCDGEKRELGPGNVLSMPPGTLHEFTGQGPALLLEISTPCIIQDNYFENSRVPCGGNYEKAKGS